MIMKKINILFIALLFTTTVFSQQFEETKIKSDAFDKLKVNVKADFALQYQALSHEAVTPLIKLGKGINLPTANFTIDGYLDRGVKVSLTTYLSSRHHTESWVKGGYLLMDEMPFFHSDFVDDLMKNLSVKVGVMEVNFGDAHFRRSDNGSVSSNPFVGNYIMDAFTTAPAMEVLYRNEGWLAMAGLNTGSLKPTLAGYSATDGYTEYNTGEELAFYWKAGFDKNIDEDIRLRATMSGFHNAKQHSGSLYNGDRTGSRYYLVMKPQTNNATDVDPASGPNTGRWSPGATSKVNSIMLNVFAKFHGLEFFGTYENATGLTTKNVDFDFNQYAIEGLYRFGKQEQFYLAARYNQVKNDADLSVDRIQFDGGWNLNQYVILKAEYVDQNYTNFTYGNGAGFKGMMIEAAISF
ncbi:MAG: hypothetical protein CVU00_05315 [Bacteroidetes bacterium HGW-Bacteroidetes-17]|nr:MAG: hypothetical protein CVU00_05315 [Bacteroidetes bacterium HGW-Bacteroidetes-17]